MYPYVYNHNVQGCKITFACTRYKTLKPYVTALRRIFTTNPKDITLQGFIVRKFNSGKL